ncbi:hypothetical protein GCM10009860_21910 [Microbacterium mitrae]|uniref:Uncharacterized protein n=1 Tax=Microbacterium mitrae TaxID=664640 RepID=A0A5C8HL26_9MICO|nr:hypothetical protein [Microbacterium mitrae]TXK04120.1 hypothetical protein FVP60_10160 [Microbacterium mitrae]
MSAYERDEIGAVMVLMALRQLLRATPEPDDGQVVDEVDDVISALVRDIHLSEEEVDQSWKMGGSEWLTALGLKLWPGEEMVRIVSRAKLLS